MTDSNSQPNPTTVRVRQGSDVEVGGSGKIRVLVVDYAGNGTSEYRELPAGATVADAVGAGSNRTVSVNGQQASPSQTLQNGDKVAATPSRPAGG